MNEQSLHVPSKWLGGNVPAVHWLVLVTLSVVIAVALGKLDIPAAMLLGPMVAGVAVTANGAVLNVPRRASIAVQGIIGCMIAQMLPAAIAGQIALHWPLFAVGVVSVIVASSVLGWLLARMRVLPAARRYGA